jgi:predicted glutamine amidotransferase
LIYFISVIAEESLLVSDYSRLSRDSFKAATVPILHNFQLTEQKNTRYVLFIHSKMCQLMGMNCRSPTDFTFSFRGFAQRGGCTDKHSHGWGLAFYEGNGLRTFLDPLPAADSPIAELVARYPVKTLNMMAHIRFATQGSVKLENVHPFSRELWGIHWSFAHNGDVPKFSNINCTTTTAEKMRFLGKTQRRCGEILSYHPVGDTDSEAVFCTSPTSILFRTSLYALK